MTGQWFSQGPPVSSTNKTDHHDITEILLKVALNTIKQIYKECLNGDCQQFDQYQQNEQSPLTEHKMDNKI